MYISSADQHYEPLYRSLSKEHSREVKKNRKLEEKVEEQADEIAELKKRLQKEKDANKKLRALLFVRNQPKTRTQREQPKVPRTAASYRRSPLAPNEHKTLAMDCCPNCSSPVTNPVSSRERVVTDIVINPDPTVTGWTINRYWCSSCNKQVEAKLPGVLPKAQLGPGVLTVVVIARYRWNLPYAKIIDHLKLSYGLDVSKGEIAHLLQTAAKLVGPKWQEITQAVKAGRAVHADETGWYIDGDKVWMHTFATEHVVLYEVANTRGKGIATNALGENFSGTLITDCLGNYKNLPGLHQICWAHITREAYENLERKPDNKERAKLAPILNQIYADLRAITNAPEWDTEQAERTRAACQIAVGKLTKQKWQDERSRLLVNRLGDYQDALFTCLNEPGIAPDNNHAERVLRKIVVQRKISGGNRSPTHAIIHAKLMSVIETLRLEEGDFVGNLQQLLQAGIAKELSPG
jgi:transposase